MGQYQTWDRCAWSLTTPGGGTVTITTSGGATWALRALIAAKDEGLRPTDGATGRFTYLIEQLRALGVQIADLPQDDQGRAGFALACMVEVRR